MHAGVFQCDGGGLSPQQRLDKLESVVGNHALDLIVCPELFLSGYHAGDALNAHAEARDGPMATQISRLAASTNTAIVYGYPEREGATLYNAANCFSVCGELVATHRKLCLPPGFEPEYFQPGNSATVFNLNNFQCGILVCYDVEFPESVRALAARGVQIIMVPTALGEQWGNVAKQLIPTRAFENGVWLMYANHAGIENGLRYFGGSCIVAPSGADAARASANEQLIHAQLDHQSVATAQARLPYLSQYPQMLACIQD